MSEAIHTYQLKGRLSNTQRVSWNSEGKPSVKTRSRYSKKGYGHIREKATEEELNHFIETYKGPYSVQKICEVLTILKSSYCHSFKKTASNREQENQKLTKEIQRIHVKSKARYGSSEINHILVNNGCYLSLKRIQRLMKKAGIRSITKKKYRPYPSKEKVIQLDNLLKRDEAVFQPERMPL